MENNSLSERNLRTRSSQNSGKKLSKGREFVQKSASVVGTKLVGLNRHHVMKSIPTVEDVDDDALYDALENSLI